MYQIILQQLDTGQNIAVDGRDHVLFIPSALLLVSLVRFSWFWWRKYVKATKKSLDNGTPLFNGSANETPGKKESLQNYDGLSITVLKFIKLLCVLALLSLQIYQLSIQESTAAERLLLVFYVCSSLCDILPYH